MYLATSSFSRTVAVFIEKPRNFSWRLAGMTLRYSDKYVRCLPVLQNTCSERGGKTDREWTRKVIKCPRKGRRVFR